LASALSFDIAVANGRRGQALLVLGDGGVGNGWFINDNVLDLIFNPTSGPGDLMQLGFVTMTEGHRFTYRGVAFYDTSGYTPPDGDVFPLWGGSPWQQFRSEYRVVYASGTYSDPTSPGSTFPWFAAGRECLAPQFVTEG
jgi:hypothetical protein